MKDHVLAHLNEFWSICGALCLNFYENVFLGLYDLCFVAQVDQMGVALCIVLQSWQCVLFVASSLVILATSL